MRITLSFDNGDELSINYNPKKSQNQIIARDIPCSGRCCVNYSRSEYNEFSFEDTKDFRDKIKPCVERNMLKYMGLV